MKKILSRLLVSISQLIKQHLNCGPSRFESRWLLHDAIGQRSDCSCDSRFSPPSGAGASTDSELSILSQEHCLHIQYKLMPDLCVLANKQIKMFYCQYICGRNRKTKQPQNRLIFEMKILHDKLKKYKFTLGIVVLNPLSSHSLSSFFMFL